MVNIIVAIGMLFACAYVGRELGGAYRKRERFYVEVVSFCVLLESEIGLFQNKLIEIFDKTKGSNKDFNLVMSGIKSQLVKSNQLDKKELSVILANLKYLSNREQEQFVEFILPLGRLDVDEQVVKVKRNRQAYEQKLAESRSENRKKGGLYTKMGLIVGCLCFIVLI